MDVRKVNSNRKDRIVSKSKELFSGIEYYCDFDEKDSTLVKIVIV